MSSVAFILRASLLGLLAIGAAGCVKEEPTKLDATVVAAADVNPDASGRPSPVVVRVYELADLKVFDSAGFFDIFESAEKTLGADLLNWTEVVLTPGGSQALHLELRPGTRFVGFVGAYRAIQDARWRASVPTPANETTKTAVQVGKLELTVGG